MSAWKNAVEARFGGREELSKDRLAQLWPYLPHEEVVEALQTIESGFIEFRVGILRPGDALSLLFTPPPQTKKFWQYWSAEVRSGDADFEISTKLNKRLKTFGTTKEWKRRILTVDDFVRAWCGQRPPTVAL
jgi:hypothetical protein